MLGFLLYSFGMTALGPEQTSSFGFFELELDACFDSVPGSILIYFCVIGKEEVRSDPVEE